MARGSGPRPQFGSVRGAPGFASLARATTIRLLQLPGLRLRLRQAEAGKDLFRKCEGLVVDLGALDEIVEIAGGGFRLDLDEFDLPEFLVRDDARVDQVVAPRTSSRALCRTSHWPTGGRRRCGRNHAVRR